MTTPIAAQRTVSKLVQRSRTTYLVVAVVFASCIVLQVFFAGAGILVHPSYWGFHGIFGYLIGFFPITLLFVGSLAKLPRPMLRLSGLALVLFALQFVFLYMLPQLLGIPLLRALHAANALALFWTALTLASQARRIVRAPYDEAQQQRRPLVRPT